MQGTTASSCNTNDLIKLQQLQNQHYGKGFADPASLHCNFSIQGNYC